VAVLNPGPRPGLGYGRAFGAKQVQQWLNGSSGVRVLAVWQVLRLRALRFAQDDKFLGLEGERSGFARYPTLPR